MEQNDCRLYHAKRKASETEQERVQRRKGDRIRRRAARQLKKNAAQQNHFVPEQHQHQQQVQDQGEDALADDHLEDPGPDSGTAPAQNTGELEYLWI